MKKEVRKVDIFYIKVGYGHQSYATMTSRNQYFCYQGWEHDMYKRLIIFRPEDDRWADEQFMNVKAALKEDGVKLTTIKRNVNYKKKLIRWKIKWN